MLRNTWNLFFWREEGNKNCGRSDDSKHGAFILGKSEQQFKIQSYFWIFDLVIGERRWYDDVASQDLKYICELFGNI